MMSKNTFKKYIQQMICYIKLTFSVDNNVISPSEMYHAIFQKEKKYDFFGDD